MGLKGGCKGTRTAEVASLFLIRGAGGEGVRSIRVGGSPRAELVPVSVCLGGVLVNSPPAVTYFPTQSPKQYRRR